MKNQPVSLVRPQSVHESDVMSEYHSAAPKKEFLMHLNRAADYIHNHYSENLNLDKLASVAHFSKYHFHRLFHQHFGETVHDYIIRVRLEQAARRLIEDANATIAQIAESCGFSSSQNFARAFQARFGCSPTSGRKNPGRLLIGNIKRPIVKDADAEPLNVEMQKFPSCCAAYIRDIGPYFSESNDRAFERLIQWAQAAEYSDAGARFIGVYWNNYKTTPPHECVFDACLIIPENVKEDGEVHIQTLPGGKFAVLHCEGTREQISAKRKRLFSDWLPASGFQQDDRPCFVIYYNNAKMNRRGLSILDICLPVKP
jgi:AraC family transcriptional regulator